MDASCLSLVLALLALVAPGQPTIRVDTLERRIHELVNAQRRQRNLAALRFDEQLATIARAHSADMARRNFFDHTNPDGLDPSARVKRAGFACREGESENLFQSNLYRGLTIVNGRTFYEWNTAEQIAKESVDGWMMSPGHRRNILERGRVVAGIGIAIAKDDKVYITELFC